MKYTKVRDSGLLKKSLIVIVVMVVVIASSLYITTLPNYDKATMEPILTLIGIIALGVIIGILLFFRVEFLRSEDMPDP